jgi:hypothetical protein
MNTGADRTRLDEQIFQKVIRSADREDEEHG